MTLAEKFKVNLDLCNLFIAIVSLGLTYQVRIMTLTSTIFKKSTFIKKVPFKCIRNQNLTLTFSRLGSTKDHHFNKLGRAHIPNATYQVRRSLAFWFWRRRFLKGFYHTWAWRPFWSCDQNIWYRFSLTYHKESSHEI